MEGNNEWSKDRTNERSENRRNEENKAGENIKY
jgi:hypothetical protein